MSASSPADRPPPARPGFWGTFPDPSLERRFRRAYVAADATAFRLVVAVAVAGTLFFVLNDLGTPAALPALLGIRAASVVASAAALWRLRRPMPPHKLDRLAFVWCLLFAGCNLAIQLVRPPAHLGHAVISVCIVMLTYGMTPLPVRLQTVVGGLHAAGCLLIAAVVNPTSDLGFLRALTVGLVTGNVLGVITSRLLHARGRQLFQALDHQAELTASLGKALAEVKTLRGLIHICAWCKHIHADGEWQRLERYVSANSHAEFTHGICPDCLAGQLTRAPTSPGWNR